MFPTLGHVCESYARLIYVYLVSRISVSTFTNIVQPTSLGLIF